jgi:hypothetical protein
MSPERCVSWLTPYQFVHILHLKMEKCLNLLFLHCRSSEHIGLKNVFRTTKPLYLFTLLKHFLDILIFMIF